MTREAHRVAHARRVVRMGVEGQQGRYRGDRARYRFEEDIDAKAQYHRQNTAAHQQHRRQARLKQADKAQQVQVQREQMQNIFDAPPPRAVRHAQHRSNEAAVEQHRTLHVQQEQLATHQSQGHGLRRAEFYEVDVRQCGVAAGCGYGRGAIVDVEAEQASWFIPLATVRAVDSLLAGVPNGGFVVRYDSQQSCFILSVRLRPVVRDYVILVKNGLCSLPGTGYWFECLTDLVTFHSHYPVLGFRLCLTGYTPCTYYRPLFREAELEYDEVVAQEEVKDDVEYTDKEVVRIERTFLFEEVDDEIEYAVDPGQAEEDEEVNSSTFSSSSSSTDDYDEIDDEPR